MNPVYISVLALTVLMSSSSIPFLYFASRDAKYKKGMDELDINTVNAKTLTYTGFIDEELKAFKRIPKKKRRMIIKDIDQIIDNVRNG